MISAHNSMQKHRYELEDSYATSADDQPVYHHILKKSSRRTFARRPGSSPYQRDRSHSSRIRTGADQLDKYLPLLRGKTTGILGNATSIVHTPDQHLVEVLIEYVIDDRFAFAPEHGYRGNIER